MTYLQGERMAEVFSPQKLYRRNFGKIERFIEISNLIEMQKESYQRFLQNHVPPEAREDYGLQGVFKSVFPIWDFSGTASLEFVSYSFADPKYDVEECLQRGMTYEAPMKLTVRLVVYEVDQETGARSIRDIKEQEIYFGTIPLMTDHGTFIINGTERVVVSQLHRSPGLYIDHDRGKTHSSGKLLYSARLIPMRGSWIDLEFDHKDILYVRIDRRRKFPVTVLLKALGYSTEELLNIFFQTEKIYLEGETCRRKFIPDFLLNKKAVSDIVDPRTGEVMVKKLKKVTKIRKRDGRIVSFDKQKIVTAIYKAGKATGEFGKREAERLANSVVRALNKRYDGFKIPTVEEIQDIIAHHKTDNGVNDTHEGASVQWKSSGDWDWNREEHFLLSI